MGMEGETESQFGLGSRDPGGETSTRRESRTRSYLATRTTSADREMQPGIRSATTASS